jgi:ATP-dependent DNA ligase
MKTHKLSSNISYGFPIPELRGSIEGMGYPAFGEIKYDGEFTFIVYSDGNIATLNKYHKIRTDFPELTGIRNQLAQSCKAAVLLAELYYGEGKRNALYDLNSNKESDTLRLSVFDLLECDGTTLTWEPLIERKEMLSLILPAYSIFPKVLKDKGEAIEFFNWTVDNGYEGAVIKSMDSHLVSGPCSWVKMKMKDRSDYKVTLVDQSKERIEVSVPIATHNTCGHVSVGVKAALRYKRHINVGDLVTIEHQGVLDSGSLRHPVLIPKKEWK